MNTIFTYGRTKFAEFEKNESGATAIEYGLIAAIVAIGCIVAFQGLSNQIQSAFDEIAGKLKTTVEASKDGATPTAPQIG